MTGVACEVIRSQPVSQKIRGMTAGVAAGSDLSCNFHLLLRIDGIDAQPYIADVGFGELTLTAPIRLVTDVEQTTPHETFRLTGIYGNFVLQAQVRDTWKSLYSFDLQPQVLPDYELASWHLANHPESPFVNNLIAARVTPDRRYGLSNNRLSIHHLQGDSEQTALSSPAGGCPPAAVRQRSPCSALRRRSPARAC